MKIYFFHTSTILGGAETLVIRTIEWFNAHGYDASIICFDDQFYKNINSDLNVVSISGERFTLSQDDILITYPFYMKELGKYIETGNAKIILWTVHYYHIMNYYPIVTRFQVKYPTFHAIVDKIIFRFKYKKLRNMILNFIEQQMLFFMDEGVKDFIIGYYKLGNYDFTYDNLLPIPVKIQNLPMLQKVELPRLRVGFIGRLDRFKIYPTNQALESLSSYYKRNQDIDIQIKIVGIGEDKELLRIPDELNAELVGKIDYKELPRYINENFDLVFAMGTTALEVSLCGKPVVLLDAMYKKFKFIPKYKFLFESKGYSLGNLIIGQSSVDSLHTIDYIIHTIVNDYESAAIRCFDYVVANHAEDVVYNKIIKLSSK